MLFDEPLNPLDLTSGKSATPLQPDRVEPELCEVVVTLHVDVRWFIAVTSIEEEPIRAKSQHRWHVVNVPEGGRR